MSGFIVQGTKSDDRDSSGLKNGLYPNIFNAYDTLMIFLLRFS